MMGLKARIKYQRNKEIKKDCDSKFGLHDENFDSVKIFYIKIENELK
jgi:hypothetical protein